MVFLLTYENITNCCGLFCFIFSIGITYYLDKKFKLTMITNTNDLKSDVLVG